MKGYSLFVWRNRCDTSQLKVHDGKAMFVVSFTRPMQDKTENSLLRKQELFFIQLPISFQKDLTKEPSQKRCKRVSTLSLQKLH